MDSWECLTFWPLWSSCFQQVWSDAERKHKITTHPATWPGMRVHWGFLRMRWWDTLSTATGRECCTPQRTRVWFKVEFPWEGLFLIVRWHVVARMLLDKTNWCSLCFNMLQALVPRLVTTPICIKQHHQTRRRFHLKGGLTRSNIIKDSTRQAGTWSFV